MENPNQPYKLLGADSLRELLSALPIPAILKFREAAQVVHSKQLTLINDVLKEKGHVEEHLRIPNGGYHD